MGLTDIKEHLLVKTLVESVKEFTQEKAMRHSAALSYYTLISLVPMLLVVMFMAGIIFGYDRVEEVLFSNFELLQSQDNGKVFKNALNNIADFKSQSWYVKVIAVLVIIFSSTAVFNSIKTSIHALWHLPLSRGKVIYGLLDRAISFGTLIAVGFTIVLIFILESLLLTSLDFMGSIFHQFEGFALHLFEFGLGIVLNTLVFALIYYILPNAILSRRKLWVGAVVTSVLFQTGSSVLGWYLHAIDLTSTYGMLGSVLLVLFWVFYSATMIFFGAKFIYVWARNTNDPIRVRRE